MTDTYRPQAFRLYPRYLRYVLYGVFLIATGLLWACTPGQDSDIEQTQAANMRLTKTLHTHLNHHDWSAVESLCAETIRYRGRATHFAEVEEPRALFLNRYRNTPNVAETGPLEIRQLYSAGGYHVIVEGLARGHPSDATLPVCLIYTIENNLITRLYAY